jgi:hypothetical protein
MEVGWVLILPNLIIIEEGYCLLLYLFIYLMMIHPSKLALEMYNENLDNINESRYTFVINPSLALYYIERLYAIGYSLHIDVSDNGQGKGIQITVKNKDKQTLHISRRAKEMLEPYIKQ